MHFLDRDDEGNANLGWNLECEQLVAVEVIVVDVIFKDVLIRNLPDPGERADKLLVQYHRVLVLLADLNVIVVRVARKYFLMNDVEILPVLVSQHIVLWALLKNLIFHIHLCPARFDSLDLFLNAKHLLLLLDPVKIILVFSFLFLVVLLDLLLDPFPLL